MIHDVTIAWTQQKYTIFYEPATCHIENSLQSSMPDVGRDNGRFFCYERDGSIGRLASCA